MLPSVSDQ